MLYSFRVTAVNDGGESFPCETLAVCQLADPAPTVLIVNGFDRVSAPAWIDGSSFSGFADFIDQGVPDRLTIGYTGRQIDLTPDSPFRTNDAPGHGASQASDETRRISGNTFDFPALHGRSIRSAGRSFVSCSDEALASGQVDISRYPLVDLIFGEEKETPVAHGQRRLPARPLLRRLPTRTAGGHRQPSQQQRRPLHLRLLYRQRSLRR